MAVARVSQDACPPWLARLPTLRTLARFPESGSLPNVGEQVLVLVNAEHQLIPSPEVWVASSPCFTDEQGEPSW